MTLLDRQPQAEFAVQIQAEMLSLSRASLYYRPRPVCSERLALMHRIDEISTVCPFYGSRKITQQLWREGQSVCRETVRAYMRQMGLIALAPQPTLSRPGVAQAVYPYLLRGLPIERPNHVWGVDITYIRLRQGFLYLVAFLDWFSRYVVSWELSETLEMAFVMGALERGLTGVVPEIINSDQGSHFTSHLYTARLEASAIRISRDGRGRCMDNIFTERLWRSVKYEEVYLNEYETPRQVRTGLAAYFAFYNHKRLHQSLDYRTPAELHFAEERITP
jgi:putative transposase